MLCTYISRFSQRGGGGEPRLPADRHDLAKPPAPPCPKLDTPAEEATASAKASFAGRPETSGKAPPRRGSKNDLLVLAVLLSLGYIALILSIKTRQGQMNAFVASIYRAHSVLVSCTGGGSQITTSYTLGRPLLGCPFNVPAYINFSIAEVNHVRSAHIRSWAQQLGLFCLSYFK